MIKVLHYIYGLNVGGAESFLYNIIHSIDKDNYQFDICVQSNENKNEKLIEEIKKNNWKIHKITAYNRNPAKNYKEFSTLIMTGEYSIVHFHLNSLINIKPLILCKDKKIAFIVHSHNTKSNAGLIGTMIHNYYKRYFSHIAFERFACGKEAGVWFFGNTPFKIIDNGIVVQEYKFDRERRKQIRERYGINDEDLVIGHVGRFSNQKNHPFVVDLFESIHETHNNSFLLLVGDGEQKKSIIEKVKKKGLEDKTIFTGNVNDVQTYLSMMDIMVFPSLYEGLPFVLLEAQAAGLPIVASSSITKDVKISDLVTFVDLNLDKWQKEIIRVKEKRFDDRVVYNKQIENSRFSSVKTADYLAKQYKEVLN